MHVQVWAFVGVGALVIATPGPDTAQVTKNALLYGRGAALGTALGVSTGLLLWTAASALGIAAIVKASALGFTLLKLLGGIYLVWLGIEALRAARRRAPVAAGETPPAARVPSSLGFRQGLFSNLANPKIAVFFTSLLPQFVSGGHSLLGPSLLLGGIFVLMTLVWLSGYAIAAARASALLRRPAVKAALDRVTGVVLIGLGIRLATERV